MLRHPRRVGSMLRAGTPELWRDHDIPSKSLGARGFGFEHGGSWGLGCWALRFKALGWGSFGMDRVGIYHKGVAGEPSEF